MKTYIALENLRSLHNIGAIFRTCSFFGFYDVLLVGYSGKIQRQVNHSITHPKIKKTSLGSEKDLNLTFIDDLEDFASKNNLEIVCVEQSPQAVPLKHFIPTHDYILVFGNEVDGVSNSILNNSNKVVQISRVGKHNSLNVTTSVGIVLSYLRGI